MERINMAIQPTHAHILLDRRRHMTPFPVDERNWPLPHPAMCAECRNRKECLPYGPLRLQAELGVRGEE